MCSVLSETLFQSRENKIEYLNWLLSISFLRVGEPVYDFQIISALLALAIAEGYSPVVGTSPKLKTQLALGSCRSIVPADLSAATPKLNNSSRAELNFNYLNTT